jgi:hypothetical protein
MDALTAQTVRRLCERLESLRQKGLIPALMAEFQVGAPEEERLPLPGFEGAAWSGSLRQLPNGVNVSRQTWLAADAALVAEFRCFCGDAGRVVSPLLRAAGYHVGIGTADPTASWLWSVFELAEAQLPGTILRLSGGDVFRSAGQGITVGERLLSGAKSRPGRDPLESLIAAAGETRYWKLADAVEASLAALDIAQTRHAAAIHETSSATSVRPRIRNTRKIDVDEALGKLETKMRKELVREIGSESAAEAALIDRLYSLSAEDMVPMLKTVGCKTSAKTIRRSKKYASWGRYRRPTGPTATRLDLGPAALSSIRATAKDAADDAVDSGHLSRRSGGRGATRIGKTAAERAADNVADQFARDAGIELPPAE